MENVENKYRNGKIYLLRNKITNEAVYVGSTTLSLALRMNAHRYDIRNGVTSTCAMLTELGVENLVIELVEEYPCNTKRELEQRETYYMDVYRESIHNKVKAGVNSADHKEYYKSNQKIKKQKYYQSRKQTVKENLREKEICPVLARFVNQKT